MSIDTNKRNKYLKTRLIQSAASGDIPMLIDLSEQFQESINYSPLLYYAIRHGRIDMANYLVSKGGSIENYNYNRTSRIPTKSLIDLIGEIKDSDPIFKYKEYLTDILCDMCFRKRYSESCLIAFGFYENPEKRIERIERYKGDLNGSKRDNDFLQSLTLLIRDNSLENLLNGI